MSLHIRKASLCILLANVVLFVSMEIFSLSHDYSLTYLVFGAQYGPLVDRGEWFRIFTSMFLHAGIIHMVFNSYALYVFGPVVEGIHGPWRFLVFYLTSGAVGNVATQFFYHDSISLGASGAIFGLIGVLFALGLKKDIPMFLRSFTGMSLLPLIAFNILYGFIPGTGINNAAHIGGFLTGMAFGYLTRIPRHWIIDSLIPILTGKERFEDYRYWRKSVIVEMVWMFSALAMVALVIVAFVSLAITVSS